MAEIKTGKSLEEFKKELLDIDVESQHKIETELLNKLQFDKIEYDAPSDDEIYNLAKSYVDEKYSKLASDKKTEVENKKTSLSDAISKAQSEYSAQQKAREKTYEKSKDAIEDQAIKRGVARSSIVLNELTDLENQKNSEQYQSQSKLSENIAGINSEIDKLSDELNVSLKNLDMQKAVELNERIEDLKAERDEKTNEMIKYNNQLKEKETNHNNSIIKNSEEEIDSIKFDFKKKKLSVAVEYFMSLNDPKKALDILENDPDMPIVLGDAYKAVYNAIKVIAN